MSANAYFRAAASNLRQAATYKQHELNDIRKLIDDIRRNTADAVSKLNTEIQRTNADAARNHSNEPNHRADDIRKNINLEGQKSKLQIESRRQIDELTRNTLERTQEIRELNQQASSLEGRS